MNRSYIITFVTFIISLLLVVVAISFQEKLADFKSFGILGIFLINFFGSATIFVPAPAIASVFAGGAIYNPFLVALVSALGAGLGDMVGYFLGYSGKNLFIKNHHTWYVFIRDLFKKFGSVVIFLFALIPNPFFDAIGIVAGALSFSPYRFFFLLFAGRLFRDLLLAYLGFAFAR